MVLDILSSPEHLQMLQCYGDEETQEENLDESDYDIEIFHEPANFRPRSRNDHGPPKQRRVTIADMPVNHPQYPPGYSGEGRQRCRSRYSTFIAGINQFDPYQELTATQIAAFRQVFDMVDRDGGGSIDANELYFSMRDLESGLKLDEIKEILEELDRDGNGEIDFEEFLYMMTSMSLQIKEAQEDNVLVKQGKRRQSIFFSVITKFAMKHSLKEIEHYYASKAKRSPHVVGHYIAGARVFGLTDKELRKTWKEFSHASKGKDSPYAQPLNFIVDDNNNGKKKMKKTVVRAMPRDKKTELNTSVANDDSHKKFVFKLKKTSKPTSPQPVPCTNTATDATASEKLEPIIECSPRSVSPCPGSPTKSLSPCSVRSTSSTRSGGTLSPSSEKRDGWTPRHRLPMTKVKLPKFTYSKKEKKLVVKDLDKIRQRVKKTREAYHDDLIKEKEDTAKEYWKSLKTGQISSERLHTNFKRVFRCYSPSNDGEFGNFASKHQRSPERALDLHRSNGGFVH